jgi:hypothetical protein
LIVKPILTRLREITVNLFARFLLSRQPSRRSLRERRRSQLRLEELESRTLLSLSPLTPAMIRHAYGFEQINFTANGHTYAGDGSGQTIAIVDAYDDPYIASDLHTFNSTFGLKDPVFVKATPQGMPAFDAGWAGEIALDVEYAHAIAPGASILLVEAQSSNLGDLLSAVDYARNQPGVVAVSMSFGGSEFNGETAYDGYFTTPAGHLGGSSGLAGANNLPGGVTFVASSGDSGAYYGVEYPSSSPNVLAVGGTTLYVSNSKGTYAGEVGWSGSGGGISQFESRPAFQKGFQSSNRRTTPDVAYDADPNSGVYVYDSANGGWFVVGGTSAGAPQWAALIAIADQGRALQGYGSLDGPSQTLYAVYAMAQKSYATYYHDITSGNNGYSAHVGYDLVTGLGSPKANALVKELLTVSGSGSGIHINTVSGTGSPTRAATHNLLATPVGGVSAGALEQVAVVTSGTVTTPARVGLVRIVVSLPAVVPGTQTVRQESGSTAGAASGVVEMRPGAAMQTESGGDAGITGDSQDERITVQDETVAGSPADLVPQLCDQCFADDQWTATVGQASTTLTDARHEAKPAARPMLAALGLVAFLGSYGMSSAEQTESTKHRQTNAA